MAKPPKHKYQQAQLENAKRAVLKHGWGLKKAARYYGVPKTTLYDNTRGRFRQCPKKKSGRQQALSTEVENILLKYALEMADRGYPLTRAAFKILVIEVIRKRNITSPFSATTGPSNKWIRKFLKRHRELSLRFADPLEESRANITQEDVDRYFELLGDILSKNPLTPSQIYNMDETGFSGKETFKIKVMARRGAKRVYQKTVKYPGHTTVLMCASADGKLIPPLTIFEGSCPDTIDGTPSTWGFTSSKSGYVNSELFFLWFRDMFLKFCGSTRPVLLVIDNHASHINPSVLDIARANQIEILCLPPHSTHILQPLDVGYFNLLKSSMTKAAIALGYGGTRTIPKRKFPAVIFNGMKHVSSDAVKSAFRSSGLFPVKTININDKLKSLYSSTAIVTQPSAENNTIELCETCGQQKENPLVRMGIIPRDLSSVLVSPPPSKKRVQRKTLTARIATAVDLQGTQDPPEGISEVHSIPKAGKKVVSAKRAVKRASTKKASVKRISPKTSAPLPSTQAGPSGIQQRAAPEMSDTDLEDEAQSKDLCCVCQKWSPPGLHLCPDLAIVNWAQCSNTSCNHWCHLRFCSKVRVVRRHTIFYCPHCEDIENL